MSCLNLQAQAGRLQLENSSPIPSNTLRDSGMLNYQQNPFNGFQRQNTQDQSQFSVPPTSSAILQNSGVGNRGERMDKRIELANSVNNLIEREEGKLIDLEATREGSLNYMLQPSSLRIEPQTPQNPSNPEFGSVGGRGFLPIANNNLTAPLTFDSPNLGFKATTRVNPIPSSYLKSFYSHNSQSHTPGTIHLLLYDSYFKDYKAYWAI